MKKYLLFCGELYYPVGGMNDFVDSFDDLIIAIDKAKSIRDEIEKSRKDYFWGHILDTEKFEVIWRDGRDAGIEE